MTHEYERDPNASPALRLHLNENTSGCAPAVIEALRSITCEMAAFYPDYSRAAAACAAYLQVDERRLCLTNGLDEGILVASVAALRGGAATAPFEVIIAVPAFDMYATFAEAAGGRLIELPLDDDFAFPLERVLGAVNERTRLVFVTTPNNPTGISVPVETVCTIADRAPNATVFVDEAYVDFGGRSMIGDPALETRENVLIGRTFAKAHGLAGLRIGALVGAGETLARIRPILPPYSLNVSAAVALPAALADTSHYESYLRQVDISKRLLYDCFERHGVQYWRSDANFVLARFGERAPQVVTHLQRRGIRVRDRSNDGACRGCVRITAGIAEHTRRCIAAIEESLCGAQ